MNIFLKTLLQRVVFLFWWFPVFITQKCLSFCNDLHILCRALLLYNIRLIIIKKYTNVGLLTDMTISYACLFGVWGTYVI